MYGQDTRAQDIVKRHSRLTSVRSNWETHWQEIAERVLPRMSKVFTSKTITQGEKNTEHMFDATAALALERFASILDSMLTPQSSKWHRLRSTDTSLNRKPRVRVYFDEAAEVLFKHRYSPRANFIAQCLEGYISLGAFGTGGLFADKLDGGGLRYKTVNLAEWYFLENHQGQIDTGHREFTLTARQCLQKFSRTSDRVPEKVRECAKQEPDKEFKFLHVVAPRDDLDPTRADFRGMPFASYYVCLDGPMIVREEGYRTFPLAVSRYVTAPGEVYGRSPAMMVLPNIKVLNEEKKTFLKVGHRLADPIFLAHDDGVLDTFSARPGDITFGGVNAQGQKMVQTLDMPQGQIQAMDKMMDMERSVIKDAFLVTLFDLLIETPQMTATEVLERVRQRGYLIAPTMGRQQSEFLGPLIERELDLLAQQRLLPPLPPELVEAGGEYTVEYDSPLSRTMRSEEAAGFLRYLDTAINVAAQTQDPSALDWIDTDTAMPELADIMAVPSRWVADPEKVLAKREGRAQQAAQQQLVDALPGVSALAKAGVGRGL